MNFIVIFYCRLHTCHPQMLNPFNPLPFPNSCEENVQSYAINVCWPKLWSNLIQVKCPVGGEGRPSYQTHRSEGWYLIPVWERGKGGYGTLVVCPTKDLNSKGVQNSGLLQHNSYSSIRFIRDQLLLVSMTGVG